MTNTRPAATIRAATHTDRDAVLDLLVDAFLESPIGDWLIPDLRIRHRVYMGYFAIHVDHALADGNIDMTTGGAALWFPRLAPMAGPEAYDARLAVACGDWVDRFRLIDELFDREHPATPTHHYLAFVGVHPAWQGLGIGSSLLDHYHAELDAQGLPAYLEASTERSRDLYLRQGYVLAASAPISLPDDGPPVWPMWRPAVDAGTPIRHSECE